MLCVCVMLMATAVGCLLAASVYNRYNHPLRLHIDFTAPMGHYYLMNKHPIIILETSGFTKRFDKLASEDVRLKLYHSLEQNPKAGDIIRGSGGIRKLRLARQGMGKRGGLRIIYYFYDARGLISLLTVYAKSDAENLPTKEIKQLRDVAETIKQEIQGD